jgi:DNA-binding transcriptional regulator YiaG
MANFFHKDFSAQVKHLRTKLAITQEELARELGVSFATVNRWENGHTQPIPMARRLFEGYCVAKRVK